MAKRLKAAFHGNTKCCLGYASLVSARSFDFGSVEFCCEEKPQLSPPLRMTDLKRENFVEVSRLPD